MTKERKRTSVRVTSSQAGVIGNNVTIQGGIHFHADNAEKEKDADHRPEPDPQPRGTVFDPGGAKTILHLSDLHFGSSEDARRWHSQLAEDLKDELDCTRLDALVLSGDIANRSEPAEYQAAGEFLGHVCDEFGLGAEQIVIVPGNHDLNWDISKKGYRLAEREEVEGDLEEGRFIPVAEDVVRVRMDDEYSNRFNPFREFYQSVKGAPYPSSPAEQAMLHHLPALNLVVIGFNSVWDADHHFRDRISISPDAVTHALNRLRTKNTFAQCLKWAVWHHPLNSPEGDRIKDHGFLQQLAKAGFSVCLHGHIHKADAGLFRYDLSRDGRRIHVVGAGTFGAPVKEWTRGYPLQYNLLRLSGDLLRVETRRRIEPNGAWEPDHQWRQGRGKPNLPYYDIPLPGGPSTPPGPGPEPDEPSTPDPGPESDPKLDGEIAAYRDKAEALHQQLPLFGFKTTLRVTIDIADIYVPLRAMMDLRATGKSCFADSEEAEACLLGHGRDCEISIPDAFREAEHMATPRRGIVILGDPGSGKTTHLKRVLLWCLRGGPVQLGLPKEMVPVFLPLRDLSTTNTTLDAFIQKQLDDPLLETPEGFGKRLLDRGSLLFLLDGLDEVADPDQRGRVSRWIERALTLNRNRNCRFVVTSRFAGYTEDARLGPDFLEMHLRPMDAPRAEAFVHNWYRIVETGLSADAAQAKAVAKTKADDLIQRLNQDEFRSRRVFQLTRNPLLLTIICLVHQDRGSLPHTRSQLYEECVEVLLEKWRGAIGFQGQVTARTGRRVLQPVAYWLHQKEQRTRAGAAELEPVVEPALKTVAWQGGSAADFLRIVRDESGLLTGWSQGEYGFMHLGFQEYLAAREIQRLFIAGLGKTDVLRELARKFGTGWWQEVILLLLAQAEHSLFEPFMREVVRTPGFARHSDLVEMCLDESAERTTAPFIELLNQEAAVNTDQLWERQLLALRVVERIDAGVLPAVLEKLRNHPFEAVRKWVSAQESEADQDVIHADPGGYELVWVPGGTFMMGGDKYDDEKPIHEVHVPGFYMGRYPVTNEEYGRFLEANPGREEPKYWGDRNFNQPRQPVVGVSWHDARRYAEWAGLHLPSEAQWEYACRAGTTTEYYTGDSKEDLDRAGWYDGNSGGKLHPVGEKEPNGFGLYDMHGNVWEWTEDHWHGNYEGAPVDGSAWVDKKDKGAVRVFRGGSWGFVAGDCRSAYRNHFDPGGRLHVHGFRLALRPGQEQAR